jgi:Protein of unknown function (DUF4435)
MISYSHRAARALGYLKNKFNDIEIYVEDNAGHAMWVRLLKRLLPSTITLKSVNLLGGRDNVIRACRLDQIDDGRKKLYIVDADFDYVAGKPKSKLKYLYRLRAYCIENLLLHKNCLAEVCRDYDKHITTANVLSRLEYDKVVGKHERLLRILFVAYAASQEIGAGLETVGYSVYKMLSGNGKSGEIDEAKLKSRIVSIIRKSCSVVGVSVFSEKRRAIYARSKLLDTGLFVSGKDILFPIVWLRLRRHLRVTIGLEDLKLQLAKEFGRSCEPLLARRLQAIARL